MYSNSVFSGLSKQRGCIDDFSMKIIKNIEVLRKKNVVCFFKKTDSWELPLVYMAV